MVGTRVKANARMHRALSYWHGNRIEAQLEAEVEQFAENANRRDALDAMDVPVEIGQRSARPRR